ncbi:MAG: patatin-like phospholipase family protein [Prevotella sp.]|nr:patatin-like phospholipase family protein [Prevotella sp.]
MRRLWTIILCAFLCAVQLAMGQETEQPRKKVGLVLGGGGAKGVAHIGVLKVLERAGLPVDIVVGTSMGSIIGGTYASGHSVAEMDSVVRRQNWQFVLSDREDLRHQSLLERQKQDTYVYSRSLSFSKKDRRGGGGFIAGKNIATLFDQLTAPYLDSIDFNMLPIPFACVATDVVDNTEYVFHSGVLSQAMRASMAIPGVFAPVRMGERVLVDGGMRNNFPADVAKEMGADFLVGVDVSDNVKKADELNSSTSIISQILDWDCMHKYEENRALTDIVIRVNIEPYTAASFSATAIDTLIRRGEEAAMTHWDEIVALRDRLGLVDEQTHVNRLAADWSLSQKRRYSIISVNFENMTDRDKSYILRKFRLNSGDSIDLERADIISTSIRQDLNYKSARARIQAAPGTREADVIFTAGPRRDSKLNVGVRFDSEEMVALQANAELPVRTKLPMEFDLTVRLGKRLMARLDWALHPMSFLKPTISYAFHNNDLSFYEYGSQAYNMTYNLHKVELSLFNFNVRNFNVALGANYDYYDYHSILVEPSQTFDISAYTKDQGMLSYEAKVWYSSENNWYFPTRGALFRARFAYYTDNFVQYKDGIGIRTFSMLWRKSFPVSSKLSVQPMLCGRFVLGGEKATFLLGNMMGGEWYGHYLDEQMPFAGVNNVEMAYDKLAILQLQAQYNLTSNNLVLLRIAAGQDADKTKDILKHQTMIGTQLSYYYNSIFGPLGGSVGYSNLTKCFYYYINLGFVF